MDQIEQTSALGLRPYDGRDDFPQLFQKALKKGSTQESGKEGSQRQPAPTPQTPKPFSDADLDQLLKGAGVEVTPRNRSFARFLLTHHMQLKPELFKLAGQMFPNGAPSGLRADALIAALGKLPPEQVASGYRVLVSALQPGVTVMGSIQDLYGLLNDFVSETFTLKSNLPLSENMLRSAIQEEIALLGKLLNSNTQNQIALLVRKEGIVQPLLRLIRFFRNFETLLQRNEANFSERFMAMTHQIRETARSALNVLVADSILSREDSHHHLVDYGASHSLALAFHNHILSCRLWAHDLEDRSSRKIDPKNVSLFFRWRTREIGVLECLVEIQDTKLDFSFATGIDEVVHVLNEEAGRIEERLKALGYQAKQGPTQHALRRSKEEEHDIKSEETKIIHLDVQA